MALLKTLNRRVKQVELSVVTVGPFDWLHEIIYPEGDPDPVGPILEPATNMSLVGAATRIANIAIILSIGVATVSLALAFVSYITSGGDPKAVQKASRALTWGVIALVVTLAVWGIKYVFFTLLGFTDVA